MICFSDRSIEKGKIESICKTKGSDLMVNLWFLEKNYTLLMVVYLQEKLNKWLIAHTNWPKTIFFENNWPKTLIFILCPYLEFEK